MTEGAKGERVNEREWRWKKREREGKRMSVRVEKGRKGGKNRVGNRQA